VITNIVEGITVYGEAASTPRAPAHPLVSANEVATMTADAVEAGRFLVVTAPEVHDSLLERAKDIEAYIQASIEAQS
jgi:hypothetical protein